MSSTATENQTLLCPVCKSNSADLWRPNFYEFESEPYHLTRCRSCQLIFVSPMPTDECITKMYGDQYFQEDFIASRYRGDYEEIFQKRKYEFIDILNKIDSVVPEKTGTFFEIGAAGGAMLRAARDFGWKTQGLEISRWGSEHCRNQYHLDVKQGNFLHTDLPANAYQVIFLGDVFEHFVDPVRAIQKIHRSIEPNGFVVLMLPMYISSWCFKIFTAIEPLFRALKLPIEFNQLLKVKSSDDEKPLPPYHVYEYSKKTITHLLEKNGFKVKLIRGNLPVPESLSHVDSKAGFWKQLVLGLMHLTYRLIKASSENLNFPLVRGIVIAQKQN